VGVADMANLNSKLYEPVARFDHVSFLVEGKVYLWGGVTQDSASGYQDEAVELARRIEQFDPYLEIWSRLNTAGIPHPGLHDAACALHGEHAYMYGGDGANFEGALSCLNFGVKTPTWSQLCPAETVGGPMRKTSCDIVHFHDDKLAVIGGYGYPNDPIQPGSVFIRSRLNVIETDVIGWTDEIHIFNISQGSDSQDISLDGQILMYMTLYIISAGVWSSPVVRGTRPPPCACFTLTSVDNHRAVLFGGFHPERGQISDIYLIDFSTMVIYTNKKGLLFTGLHSSCSMMNFTSSDLLGHRTIYCVCIGKYDYRIIIVILSLSPKWSHMRVSRGQWGEVAMQPVVLDMLEITSTCW
jgi:hypothetical protein